MLTGTRRYLALTVTVLAALLATTDASASGYFDISPGGSIAAATSMLRFNGGGLIVECAVTLAGSLGEGEIEGRLGTSIGNVSMASIPRCSGGTVTATTNLPWSLEYDGITGVLPNVTGLRLRLNRLSFAFTFFGIIRCEYSGVVPLVLALTASNPPTSGGLTVAGGTQLQLSGGTGCPTTGSLAGNFSFTQQAIRANPVWIASMGDSFISGEAGRWAGNTAQESQRTDALGPTAYFDNPAGTAEAIDRCHRSRSAEIHIGGGVSSINFACSGALTVSARMANPILPWQIWNKPGLDWLNNGVVGQAEMLRNWLRFHPRGLRMIEISIGGNDFNFGTIVERCLADFLTPVLPGENGPRCSLRPEIQANFAPANVAVVRNRIRQAILRVRQVMFENGHPDATYKILVQTYPSPLPEVGARFRYPETGVRQGTGGCGIYNVDAAWANVTALPTINAAVFGAMGDTGLTNLRLLDVSRAFMSHRLCEQGTDLVEEIPLARWSDNPGLAATWSEWVNQIRTITTAIGPYYLQEGIHPNYWGQLAMRNCVRQAYNGGNVRGGICRLQQFGINNLGEPLMQLD